MTQYTTICICCGKPSDIPGRACSKCTDYRHSGTAWHIPDGCEEGVLRLAGAILDGAVYEYRSRYRRAVREVHAASCGSTATECRPRFLPECREFIALHRRLQQDYYQGLSMGRMDAILDTVRAEENKRFRRDCRDAARAVLRCIGKEWQHDG